MEQEVILKLLDQVTDIHEKMGELSASKEADAIIRHETKQSMEKFGHRLDILENKVEDAANTWKMTKKLLVGAWVAVLAVITLPWTAIKTAVAYLWHL